jgi:TrmH family RNA methyltransferase
VRVITSRHNPAVRSFREAIDAGDRSGTTLLLDGSHLVGEALSAGLTIELAAVAATRLDGDTEERRLADALERVGVDVIAAADRVFSAISPVKHPSGIVAIARRDAATAAAVCARPDALVLAVVDVQDPGNLGAILRVGEAAGVTGVLACGASANPFSWRSLRGSMGSALRLPIAASMTIDAAFECMKDAGLRTVAAVARGGSDPDAVRWDRPTGVLLGGEGSGLSDAVARGCDDRVTVPMTPPVESLNVAVAAAIVLYAARRQRRS